MPIRWYGPADPTDPTYRHFERIVNLCLHAGVFAAVNSGALVRAGNAPALPIRRSDLGDQRLAEPADDSAHQCCVAEAESC